MRGGSQTASWTYSYDPDNRLRSATEAGTVNPAARTFQASYNELNEIVQVNGVDFAYDADGELTSDGVNTYTWDAAQRLASVTNIASGEKTSYTYDGLGRRIAVTMHAQSSQPVTSYYLWCDSKICQEHDRSNNVTARYFTEGEEQDGLHLLYARDRLGSVVNLVDGASGAVVADYTYDPWGKVTSQTGGYTASFGYAGMFNDEGTGLNLTLYRAYNPVHNRWLSRDPVGEGVGPNLYAYVEGNPLSRVDPLGLDWIISQSTGQLFYQPPDFLGGGAPQLIGQGYSGHGLGLNNPALQNVPNIGPLPQGTYTIGPQQDNGNLTASMRLTPDPANQMFNRYGFLIHGPHGNDQYDSSNGCPVFKRDIRDVIGNSADKVLRVVP